MPVPTLLTTPGLSPASELRSTSEVPSAGDPSALDTASPASPAAPLRLTRRGRLVLIGLPAMLTAAAALTMLGFFTAPAMASNGGPDVTRTVQVSVGPGESLWGLAQEYAPDRDPRAVVADMIELNNLSDDRIPAGVQLFIPVAR
ncbi:LysM peptidoglycan-binding domain-containing protein [Arthrobacter jiangjiafuii]|uniref:LysM peptidoglycan-binding domain-containing protein n=2 Tax=Arthrobacter jiangjiafuii TaxID=2817475 RepID=A0A975M7A1_9MICC|nr:LysM peptidoglycan-binding domain-containing protein [Arthrobacter jiangjiafuii]QWC11115.1 LysM peptidoglycan-binding domain-containing protein [Arthrobacter jiangjiafuii]